MRLLFVEDEPDVAKTVIRRLEREGFSCDCEITDFEETENAIGRFAPDVVILDLVEGGSTPGPRTPGLDSFKFIWDSRFCPIVVYSAFPDLFAEEREVQEHPFVRIVKKGSGSPARVKTALDEFIPHVDALRCVENHIRSEFALALRDVAPPAFQYFSDENERNDAILRSARRRLAALMDDQSRHGETLASWEQYLFPPVSSDLQLGDILGEKGRPENDPNAFRVVLTPSCDLVKTEMRERKVDCVLVARCHSIRDGIQSTSIEDMSPGKLKGRLNSMILSQGHFETIIPFPALAGRIPSMFADLRDLELMPLDQIEPDGAKYERVASIDSPFRELVAWAYMHVACRPGLPDRNLEQWNKEIISKYQEDSE